jgi:YVTN family beta-propeller protein
MWACHPWNPADVIPGNRPVLRRCFFRDEPVSYLRLSAFVFALMVPVVAGAADGGVYLYLQPLPLDAARITFEIASVSAVTGSGIEYPLKLNLGVVGQGEAQRQRLLASGRVPAGTYAGFNVRIKRAVLKNPDGQVALAVPEAPVRLDVQLGITGRQSSLVWLSLKLAESMPSPSAFSPVFAAVVPPSPIADHAGFVTNSGSDTITVFDRQIMQAVAVVDTCAGPAGLALDQRRRRLYVACSRDDELQSIDVSTGGIIDRTGTSPGDRPRELALTPDGSTLVSVNTGSNSISFFDTAALTRQDRVDVGSGPGSVAIDPTGRRAFVFNTLSSSVSVVDIANRAVVATLATEASPLRGQFSARGDRLYVIQERSPYMMVFDPQQLTTVTRARLNSPVSAIAVDRVRGLICLSGSNQTTVDLYDPNALMPLYMMRIRSGASYLAVVPDDSTLYMVSPDTRSLLVGRLADRKVVSEIDVGDGPYWVAIMGEK